MEDKISTDNVEVCVIKTDTKKLEFRTAAHIQAILDTLANWETI